MTDLNHRTRPDADLDVRVNYPGDRFEPDSLFFAVLLRFDVTYAASIPTHIKRHQVLDPEGSQDATSQIRQSLDDYSSIAPRRLDLNPPR